jgi:hypothetical protein
VSREQKTEKFIKNISIFERAFSDIWQQGCRAQLSGALNFSADETFIIYLAANTPVKVCDQKISD